MMKQTIVLGICCALGLVLAGCSRQQSDWQKTRETNTADAYEQFLKKYPSGEFTAQAQARVKEMYEEHDWQKARDADTPEAYQAFLKQYPEGKWTEEARIRVENFTLAQAPGSAAAPTNPAPAGTAAPAGADSAAVATGSSGAAGDVTEETPSPPRAKAARAAPAQQPDTAAAPAGTGAYGVQLGAFKSGAKAANERWAHLKKEYPSLLTGLSSKVSKTADGNLYRLQALGLTEKHARQVCSALRAKSQACVVITPTHG